MLRFLLALAAVVAVLPFDARPARAGDESPWCAVISIGNGSVYWDCQYRTVEECGPNVLAGNRGTCNPNPRWEGWSRPAEPRRHGKRRAQPH